MFETDNEIIAFALRSWANYIETNNMSLSRNDAIRLNQHKIIKSLSEEQERFIIRIKELANKYD